MSNSNSAGFKARRNAMQREVSAAIRASGIRRSASHADSQIEREWLRQMNIMPDDTRTVTSYVMGDPVPGDPRCPWRPSCRVEGRPS